METHRKATCEESHHQTLKTGTIARIPFIGNKRGGLGRKEGPTPRMARGQESRLQTSSTVIGKLHRTGV